MTTNRIPVAEGLFTWPADEPALIGSRCADCAVTTFPRQDGCPKCAGSGMADVLLPRRGTLWTFTTQEFLPKSPPYAGEETAETFVPYGVGYVQLGEEVKVEGRLTESDVSRLRIGMQMELALIPLRRTPEGEEIVTFAFSPVVA